MANQEQLEILKQGVDVWNKWRKKHSKIYFPDLSQSDLKGADLNGANLSGADLSSAFLWEANLSETNLTGANLSKANLNGANLWLANLSRGNLLDTTLTGVDLTQTNLTNANLSAANLSYANLSRANLSATKFVGTYIGSTVLAEIDLSQVDGLEKVIHESSSYISTDTIHLSKGRIPIVFLRGCGLSDLDIEYAKLATPNLDPEQVTDITYKIHQLYLGGGIQYYSCFISYSSKDYEFAQRLYNDLQNNSVRCWFDREDLKIGDQLRPTIDRQIRVRDKLLVILSESSVKSEWVGDEVEGAIEEEGKSSRLVLFPIRLDDTVLNTRDDWAAKIKRRRHIGDFSNWKDTSSYQKAFERLLRDLKATSGGSLMNEK